MYPDCLDVYLLVFVSRRLVRRVSAQSFTNYFLLCFVYCTALSCKTGEEGLLGVLRRRGLKYFLLALIDVEANYMIVSAYQFTNITSVQVSRSLPQLISDFGSRSE